MLGITDYGAFVACAVMLNLTPGTDTVYVISRSIAGGRKPGAVSALGISTGILMHTVLCASGLSIVLARSAMAFAAVKTVGGVYAQFSRKNRFLIPARIPRNAPRWSIAKAC